MNQQDIEKNTLSDEKYLIICGHYEGIDERIFELFEIEEISIGNYVLSSGELA
jgi:tRNA (guanine37-N1)-methyltransferase